MIKYNIIFYLGITMEQDISQPLSRLMKNTSSLKPTVKHYFSEGICIREMSVPAGSIIIGAEHKTAHITMFLKGTMQVRIGDEIQLIEAPATFESLAGSRKLGFAYTDCVVSNVFPTDSRDIDEIERMFTTLKEDKARLSFCEFLKNSNLTIETVNAISFDVSTYEATGEHKIKDSLIHGKGLFATKDYVKGDLVGTASKDGIRFELGRYVNHSDDFNLVFSFEGTNCVAYASKDIKQHEEFTVDYNNNIDKIKELT